MSMTTVGELKSRLADLPDTTPLEFWVLEKCGPFRLVSLELGNDVRFPAHEVVEIVLKAVPGSSQLR